MTDWFSPDRRVRLINADCRDALKSLPDQSANCCVTSPPYFGLRDYGVSGQIGLETTPAEFVAAMVEVFREVRRVLRDDGTLWLNLGDSYNNAGSSRNGEGLDGNRRGGATGADGELGYKKRDNRRAFVNFGIKHKDLLGIPWRVAFALQSEGWYLRQDIIWAKPNPMPESVKDRCTKAHEYIFLLSKSPRYYFDSEAIAEAAAYANTLQSYSTPYKHIGRQSTSGNERPGAPRVVQADTRNKRSVWTIGTQPFPEAHFATFPPDLIRPCILAGCPEDGIVLEPFAGSGTTLAEAYRLNRRGIGIELNPAYCEIAKRRIGKPLEASALFVETIDPIRQPELFTEGAA
jgi:DNA modification methylase